VCTVAPHVSHTVRGRNSWSPCSSVTAVLAVGLAVTGRLLLAESAAVRGRRVDVAGIVLLAAGLSCLLAGLVQTRGGWSRTSVPVLLGSAVLLLAAFVLVERRTRAPMIDLALVRVPGFLAATVGAFLTGAAVVGLSSYLPTVLQRGLGQSLLAATLLVLLWSAVSTVTALAVRLLPGLDGRVLLAFALAVSSAGLAGYAVLAPGATGWRLVPGLVVLGVGYGAANAALGREAVAHVPPDRAAMGSGANNTARYLGAAVGVTVVVLVAGAGAPAGAVLVALIRPATRRASPVTTPSP
jgi:hypothetical protein